MGHSWLQHIPLRLCPGAQPRRQSSSSRSIVFTVCQSTRIYPYPQNNSLGVPASLYFNPRTDCIAGVGPSASDRHIGRMALSGQYPPCPGLRQSGEQGNLARGERGADGCRWPGTV